MFFAACSDDDTTDSSSQPTRYAGAAMTEAYSCYQTGSQIPTAPARGTVMHKAFAYTNSAGTVTMNGVMVPTDSGWSNTASVGYTNFALTQYNDTLTGGMDMVIIINTNSGEMTYSYDSQLTTGSGHTLGIDVDLTGSTTSMTYTGTVTWDGTSYDYNVTQDL